MKFAALIFALALPLGAQVTINGNSGGSVQVGSASSGGGVSTVSVTTANGVSGSVATATTTPAITLTLGAITPSSITIPNNGVNPNQLALPWNTTANAAPTNATGWEGAVSSSGTSGWFDLPSALPTTPSVMVFATGASSHSVPTLTPYIANIQITTGTTPIAGNTCTTNTATTMTGLTTTSAIIPPTPTTSTAAVTGWGSVGGLSFTYYLTANTFNWSVCNTTATSITPGGSLTWNVGAR